MMIQDARLGPVIARALTSDVCSRINIALRVAIAGGQLSDFAYPLWVSFSSVSVAVRRSVMWNEQ